MKRAVSVIGVSLVLLTVSVMAQNGISGSWDMTFNTDQGSQAATLVIEQDGETFSGQMQTEQGNVEFDGGTITGDQLEWVMEVDAGGAFLEIAMSGTVTGDEMTGSADFGGYGGGDWSAKRAQ